MSRNRSIRVLNCSGGGLVGGAVFWLALGLWGPAIVLVVAGIVCCLTADHLQRKVPA